jgi:hypothetical protein
MIAMAIVAFFVRGPFYHPKTTTYHSLVDHRPMPETSFHEFQQDERHEICFKPGPMPADVRKWCDGRDM